MKYTTQKNHRIVERPWGGYLILEKHPTYWLKKLFVNKDESLSLQSHKGRCEIWVILEGKVSVQKGSRQFILEAGEFLKINVGERHRINGLAKSCILEVAFGILKEGDIIRYKDKYGRAK